METGNVDSMKNNIDGLIGSLSNATFDIHADLTVVMESFAKGHITASMLEDMVRTEHARSLMLRKMTASMKVQLEEVFVMVEKVADSGEACIKHVQQSMDSNKEADSGVNIKELGKQINSIYTDFSDVMQTIDSMDVMVRVPAVKVSETIGKLQSHIETKLAAPGAQARRLSAAVKYDYAAREQHMPNNKGAPTDSSVGGRSGSLAATIVEGDVDTTLADTQEDETFPGSAQVVDMYASPADNIGSKPSTAGLMRVKAVTTQNTQTDLTQDERTLSPSRQPVALAAPVSPTAFIDNFDTLLIKGSRASGSTKEIDKARKLIQERQAELQIREDKLAEQQSILDSRADELRRVAQKVVQHESEAQRQMKQIHEMVREGVQKELAKLGGGSASADSKPVVAEGDVTEASRLTDADPEDTKSFLEASLRNAQAGHSIADASLSKSVHSDLELQDPAHRENLSPLVMEGGGFDALRTKSQNGSRPATPEFKLDSLKSSSPVYNPSGANSIPGSLVLQSRTDMGTFGGMGRANIQDSGYMSPVNIPPPEKPKAIPDMIVIFPPKTVNKGTSTDDLIMAGGGFNSAVLPGTSQIQHSKILITSRHGGHSVKKEPMSDMLLGDSLTLGTEQVSTAEASVDPNMRADLPTVHAQDGLITRTYRHIPARDIRNEVMQSENPLLLLYHEYKDCLSDVFRGPFLDAASGASQLKVQHTFHKLFSNILPDMRKLDSSSSIVLKELTLCEEMTNSMIVVSGSGEVPDALYHRSLRQMFIKFGEIESLKLWVEIQLGQYRTIFERVNALHIAMIPNMLKASDAFEEAYQVFVSCSGRSVEAHSRFTALKNRCKRYKIGMENTNNNQFGGHEGMVNMHAFAQLQEEVQSLRADLAEAEEENEELNLEVFKQMQEGDRTPGALLFFAALHDPVTISVLQQVTLQLKALKGFSDATEHIDFTALRKRLQVCLSCVPNVERFVSRYSALHKKWCTNRLGLFTMKAQVGGSSDAVNLCPMCSNDPSKFAPPGGAMKRRSEAAALKEHRREHGAPTHEQIAAVKHQQQVQMNQFAAKKGGKHKHGTLQMDSMTDSMASMGSRSMSEHTLPSVKNIPN